MASSKGKKSAGILLFYRNKDKGLMVFLIHHGGPLWEGKENGAYDIPKGEPDGNTDLLEVAKREFFEETGIKIDGKFIDLGSTFNKWGKEIFIWAIKGKGNEKFIKSNLFEMEWPKGSGKLQSFPEADKGKYMDLKEAKVKGHSYTSYFFDKLIKTLSENKEQKKLF